MQKKKELVLFGEIIRKKRIALNMSQESLALIADIDRSFLSEIERGIKQPTLLKILSLSQGLNIKSSELFVLFEKSYFNDPTDSLKK